MPPLSRRLTSVVGAVLVAAGCGNKEAPAEATAVSMPKPAATAAPAPGKCDASRDYDAPAQRFDERAQDLAHATGCFIETDVSETGAVRVPAMKGIVTIRQAIAKSIEGTRLKVTRSEPDLIAVEVNHGAKKDAR